MSDRYVFEDQRPQGEEGGAPSATPSTLESRYWGNAAREFFSRALGEPHCEPGDALKAERREAHEHTPLSLTSEQRNRIWIILRDECGPNWGLRLLKRIEAEA